MTKSGMIGDALGPVISLSVVTPDSLVIEYMTITEKSGKVTNQSTPGGY